MNGDDIRVAAGECCALLDSVTHRDWGEIVPDLGWTIRETLAHIGECLLWYTHAAAAGPERLGSVEPSVTSEVPEELVATIRVHAQVLASVVDALPASTRGYHMFGVADPSGFAAMACDELLVHTDDAARTLDVGFAPDPGLCDRTLRRLFPDTPADPDPWTALRWANGRLALPDRPRREGWRWYSAPADEQGDIGA